MPIHITARGTQIDLDKLKLYNETTITVGNTQTNVRGDIVKGGKIVKTREEVMREHYNLSGNNIPKHPKPQQQQIEADDLAMGFEQPIEEPITASPVQEEKLRGGLADAVARSQELSEKLANQRKR